MPRKYFTVEEANALLPTLRPLVAEILAARQRILDSQNELAPVLEKAGSNGGNAKLGPVLKAFETVQTNVREIENLGVELRGRFIIDPDGVIQAMEVLTPPVGRRFAETLRQIQAFQHVRASKGTEATPAGWMPGQLTLNPGPGLVGRVWEVWQPNLENN